MESKLLPSLKTYLAELLVSTQLQLAPERQAYSKDQICTVNGFTGRRIEDIM